MAYTYTRVGGVHVVVCNDCGAYAAVEEDVVHYPQCEPGESERWRKYYDEAEEDMV